LDRELDRVRRLTDLAVDVVFRPVAVRIVGAADAAVRLDLEYQFAGAPPVVVQLERAVEVARLELVADDQFRPLLRLHARKRLRDEVQLRLADRPRGDLLALDRELNVAAEFRRHYLAEIEAESEP